MKPFKIGPFLGVNNRLPDFSLHIKDTGDYLRSAINVDIDNAGSLRDREVEVLVQSLSSPHSLHMVSDSQGYLIRSGILYLATVQPSYSEAFVKALSVNDRGTWSDHIGDLYFSNGTDSFRISGVDTWPIGLPTPSAPTLSSIAGSLHDGKYKVCVAHYNSATEEEGGISPSANIDLSTGGIRVTLPASVDGANQVALYLSAPNGSVPCFVGYYTPGSTVDFSAMPATFRETNGRFEEPLPPGCLFSANGRLCSFKDGFVYIGLPFRPGYYLPASGYVAFPDAVTIAIENQGGTYIVADKTYWVPGDLDNVESMIVTVLPYGAALGSEYSNPANSTVGWFGENGFVVADTSGSIEPVMDDPIDLVCPSEGCSTVRASNGYLRVVGCGWCLNLENNAATQYQDYGFTSISGEYGTKADGVYALSGGSSTIYMEAGAGKLDFGTQQLKQIPAIYLGASSDDPLSARLQTARGDDYTYEARSSDPALMLQRVDPGLGLESNWFDLTILPISNFNIASVTVMFQQHSRRI